MKYKRLTKSASNELLSCGKISKENGEQCCNNCSWCEHQQNAFQRLSEFEDLIEKAENGEAKKLKKENAVWAYEMIIGSYETNIKDLVIEKNKLKAANDLLKGQVNNILELQNENEKLKQEIKQLKELNNTHNFYTNEEEKEEWWQK